MHTIPTWFFWLMVANFGLALALNTMTAIRWIVLLLKASAPKPIEHPHETWQALVQTSLVDKRPDEAP